ncbi:hypothetical protein BLNAU_2946 [Blattamonas nauphoetae]|uniref:CCR4-NOT transcription complex subunit 11 n=1 Tax=Blattamonas nauphoetae TaxID=2049346 RepID=A0ABQ9YF84_9EUKA|nr:hypothetical protein BLNAU_2946 [Blattamonas nauphoetae]
MSKIQDPAVETFVKQLPMFADTLLSLLKKARETISNTSTFCFALTLSQSITANRTNIPHVTKCFYLLYMIYPKITFETHPFQSIFSLTLTDPTFPNNIRFFVFHLFNEDINEISSRTADASLEHVESNTNREKFDKFIDSIPKPQDKHSVTSIPKSVVDERIAFPPPTSQELYTLPFHAFDAFEPPLVRPLPPYYPIEDDAKWIDFPLPFDFAFAGPIQVLQPQESPIKWTPGLATLLKKASQELLKLDDQTQVHAYLDQWKKGKQALDSIGSNVTSTLRAVDYAPLTTHNQILARDILIILYQLDHTTNLFPLPELGSETSTTPLTFSSALVQLLSLPPTLVLLEKVILSFSSKFPLPSTFYLAFINSFLKRIQTDPQHSTELTDLLFKFIHFCTDNKLQNVQINSAKKLIFFQEWLTNPQECSLLPSLKELALKVRDRDPSQFSFLTTLSRSSSTS